jgi:carboxyl-terminal processing protease
MIQVSRYALALSFVAICTLAGSAAVAQAPMLTAEQQKRNLESFELVWRTIKDKHWDPTLGGLDWQAVHDEFRPKVENARNMAECRSALSAMIHKLEQSHFQILATGAYSELSAAERKRHGQGGPGLDFRVLDGEVIVTEVESDAPAAKLGVKPGWQIVEIDGESLAPAIAKLQKAFKGKLDHDFQLARAIRGRLRGNTDEKLPVVFRDGAGKDISLELPLVKARGVPAQFGNLPAIYVFHETKKLEANVGYFRLSAFFDPVNVMKAFEESVRQSRDADGFILDLRGNPGGIGFLGLGMGGWFIKQPDCKLGTMTTRVGPVNFVLNPRLETFEGPLAILVDGLSVSTSEILAGGLQDLKRARVFGTTTAGGALPSQVEKLPNGDGFQYAIADYVSTGGKRLEGKGVTPDVEVRPDRKSLLAGKDVVLDAAVDWIKSQSRKTAP